MDTTPYTSFKESRNSTECIDEASISRIENYLLKWTSEGFRIEHPNVDDFFTQIEFNKYLMQFHDRQTELEYMNQVASSNRSNQITINSEFPIKLREKNTTCLEFAKKVERLAGEEYDKFKELSDKYKSDPAKYGYNSSFKSSIKGIIGYGTKSRYEAMTDIPLCLYWTMLKFAEAILNYENILFRQSQIQPSSVVVGYMQQQVSNTSFEKLSELLQNLTQSEDNLHVEEGGSRRHTRRHRHRNGRSRRHHSKHSHKSVKRSKKGKKIMKSHTRKRHTHARKQNRRRNRSRK
jgi:hypothetical protein